MIIILIGIFFVFFIISAFIFWRSMKEDYLLDQVYSSLAVALFGLVSGRLFGLFFNIPQWYWLSVVFTGVLLGLYFVQNNIKLTEVVEALAPGIVLMNLSLFIIESVKSFLLSTIIVSGVLLFILFINIIIKKRYKSFRWYRSGKVGLPGLITISLTYMIFFLVEIVSPDVIFFTDGISGLLLLAVLGIMPLVMVFPLSKKK